MSAHRLYARFTEVEKARLRVLWPTAISDKELAQRFGRDPATLRRIGKRIGLPLRRAARAAAMRDVEP